MNRLFKPSTSWGSTLSIFWRSSILLLAHQTGSPYWLMSSWFLIFYKEVKHNNGLCCFTLHCLIKLIQLQNHQYLGVLVDQNHESLPKPIPLCLVSVEIRDLFVWLWLVILHHQIVGQVSHSLPKCCIPADVEMKARILQLQCIIPKLLTMQIAGSDHLWSTLNEIPHLHQWQLPNTGDMVGPGIRTQDLSDENQCLIAQSYPDNLNLLFGNAKASIWLWFWSL